MIGSDQKRYVYWCRNCGVPLLQPVCQNCGTPGTKMGNDLRPIFEEEKVFIENRTGETLPNDTRLLWMRRRTIWFNGNRYMRLSTNGGLTISEWYPVKDSTSPPIDDWSGILWKANSNTLEALEREAINFIRRVTRQYPNRMPLVSFSGGKDSTLVSHLVCKALETEEVPHVFGDTTMEFPDTYEYIKQFCETHPEIPFMSEKAATEWYSMCRVMGIPSRFFPWCCSVFKASPISTILYKLRESNGQRPLMNFEGIRRVESNKRRLRERINTNSKLRNQISVEPIIDWRDIHVWLYILGQGIPFNQAYRKGFSRVGCLYCPHHPSSTQTYLSFYFPQHILEWKAFVIKQAEKLGKEDPLEYWQSEAWKINIGANGMSRIRIERKPCSDGSNIFNFILKKKFSRDLLEYFKVFGQIQEIGSPMGVGVSIIKDGQPLFIVEGVEGFPRLKVSILVEKRLRLLLRDFERQLRKSQACEICGACRGLCPQGAIHVDGRYTIDDKRCNHCGLCIRTKPFQSSCIAVEAKRRFSPVED